MNVALKQASELARVERAAALEVRKVMTQFKLIAIRRALRGDTSYITQKEIDRLVRVLAAAMAAADYYGKRRARLTVMKASIIDDFFDVPDYNLNALNIITSYTQVVNDKLNLFTRNLINENLPTTTMTRLLGEEFDRLGVSPTNAYQLENAVRTQAQITYNAAKYKEEQEDYIQEILWGYKYVTTGDDRVRPEHARLEGVTLPKDDPFWQRYYPPNGWSCRCQVIPVFDKQKIVRPRGDITIDPKFSTTPDRL